MSRITVFHSKLLEVIDYLQSLLPLANCHTVDFITNDLWETLVPVALSSDVDSMNIDSFTSIFRRFEKNVDVSGDCLQSGGNENSQNVLQFLSHARAMSLCSFTDLTLSCAELREKLLLLGSGENESLCLMQFMSQKKTHEVEVMSEVVASVANACQVSHVVDVGSGKGYLSSMLALHHRLAVLGIDSSQINNHGAVKRTKKLERVWAGLCRKAPTESNGPDDTTNCSESNKNEVSEENLNEPSCIYKQATVFITQNTDLDNLVDQYFPDRLLNEHLALVGLHTCGDLAPTALKLFRANDKVNGLVNVGCCYHLLSEEFADNPFEKNPEFTSDRLDLGFPMSDFLRSRHFSLGRNARMLAAQSLERILETPTQVLQSAESLHYRALLQVLLVKKLGAENLPKGNVGRIASKCSDFCDYIHRAIKKLGVDVKVTDAEIKHLYALHEASRYHLQVFFLLRIALAPVIEGVILLDRLLYLLEQDINDAFLVRLFDPVISPRCYGIIALNKHLSQ